MTKLTVVASGCWEWLGAPNTTGYGICSYQGRQQPAHRVAWQLFRNEPLPPSIHHTCHNRICVNPDHLEGMEPGEHTRLHKTNGDFCINGHRWTDANTYMRKDGGGRQCKRCNADREKRYVAENPMKYRVRGREESRKLRTSGRTSITCPKCDAHLVKAPHSLAVHISKMHPGERRKLEARRRAARFKGRKGVKCPRCGKKMVDQRGLTIHLTRSH